MVLLGALSDCSLGTHDKTAASHIRSPGLTWKTEKTLVRKQTEVEQFSERFLAADKTLSVRANLITCLEPLHVVDNERVLGER